MLMNIIEYSVSIGSVIRIHWRVSFYSILGYQKNKLVSILREFEY